jgi:hypothetical protein
MRKQAENRGGLSLLVRSDGERALVDAAAREAEEK